VIDDLDLRCDCGVEYLSLADLTEDGLELCSVSITAWPHTFKERLERAWLALCGRKFYYNEVLFCGKDARQIRDWFASHYAGEAHD
jgi:hypothetical protein